MRVCIGPQNLQPSDRYAWPLLSVVAPKVWAGGQFNCPPSGPSQKPAPLPSNPPGERENKLIVKWRDGPIDMETESSTKRASALLPKKRVSQLPAASLQNTIQKGSNQVKAGPRCKPTKQTVCVAHTPLVLGGGLGMGACLNHGLPSKQAELKPRKEVKGPNGWGARGFQIGLPPPSDEPWRPAH